MGIIKVDDSINQRLREVISNVNSSLRYYAGAGFSSAKRFSTVEHQERAATFRQFIEIRLNFEMEQVFPEVADLIRMSEGRLFTIIGITSLDETRKRFGQATAVISSDLQIPKEAEEYWGITKEEIISNTKNFFGFEVFKFGSSEKRFKIVYE